MAIKFYKEYGDLGYLATYSNHGFIEKGIYYQTSEHYYQSKKFINKSIVSKILLAPTPKIASEIGRDRNNKLRNNWRLIKNDVMYNAVFYKFFSNEELREKLLATGNEEIIEETVKENYWGCGPNKDGKNNYGKILELVRENMRRIIMKEYRVTREGYNKLMEEYQNIEDEYIATTKAMGKSDEMDSDLRENPEFMDLRAKAMYAIPQKKRALFEMLQRSVIIEDTEEYKNWDRETVIEKCGVVLDMDGETVNFSILGANQSDIYLDIISTEAPLTQALIGHKKGETIIFNDMRIIIKDIYEINEQKISRKRGL